MMYSTNTSKSFGNSNVRSFSKITLLLYVIIAVVAFQLPIYTFLGNLFISISSESLSFAVVDYFDGKNEEATLLADYSYNKLYRAIDNGSISELPKIKRLNVVFDKGEDFIAAKNLSSADLIFKSEVWVDSAYYDKVQYYLSIINFKYVYDRAGALTDDDEQRIKTQNLLLSNEQIVIVVENGSKKTKEEFIDYAQKLYDDYNVSNPGMLILFAIPGYSLSGGPLGGVFTINNSNVVSYDTIDQIVNSELSNFRPQKERFRVGVMNTFDSIIALYI